MEDAGHDQGQVRRRATFRPPSLACLAAHLAGAGDRNLSFVLAPPSVPANLNVYGEGLVRLGILQSSASAWNGEFPEAQWAALLASGKVRHEPPRAPAVRAHGLTSDSSAQKPASCSSRWPRARQGLMAPAPLLAAPAAPIASAEQAAAALTAAAAASTSATSAAAFAFPQPAGTRLPPGPLSEQVCRIRGATAPYPKKWIRRRRSRVRRGPSAFAMRTRVADGAAPTSGCAAKPQAGVPRWGRTRRRQVTYHGN